MRPVRSGRATELIIDCQLPTVTAVASAFGILLRYSRYTSTLRTLRTLHSALHFALHFLYLHTSSAAVDHPPNEFSVLQTVQAVYVPENYATYAIHSARPQGLIAKQKTRG